MRKAQIWSSDAVIAVAVLVVAVIGLIVFTGGRGAESQHASLVEENSVVADALVSQQAAGGIIDQSLDEDRIRQLHAMDYDTLKRELGIKSDLCIHFTDDKGSLVPIAGVWFLGSPDITVTVPTSTGDMTFTCNGSITDCDCGTIGDVLKPLCRGGC